MDNTKVESVGYTRILSLFGNDIAHRKEGTREISIQDAGWKTNTTQERLNGIPGVRLTRKKGVWFLNGEEWDGTWKTI